MNIHLWGATVLREFCSSTGAALFKRGAVPTGPTSGHRNITHQRPKSMLQIYLSNKLEYISLRCVMTSGRKQSL